MGCVCAYTLRSQIPRTFSHIWFWNKLHKCMVSSEEEIANYTLNRLCMTMVRLMSRTRASIEGVGQGLV